MLLGNDELGFNSGIKKLYSAFDLFILPSLYEGLPVSGIEAQIASLPCVFSSEITKEVDAGKNVSFVGLDEPIEKWTKVILEKKDISRDEKRYIECYDRNIQSKVLFKTYDELLSKETMR